MDEHAEAVLEFSDHARDRMTERRISEHEVRDALANAYRTETVQASKRIQDVLSPSEMLERIDVCGTTDGGRRLRVTRPQSKPALVISVVDLGDEGPDGRDGGTG
jgi:hypothetical protein